MAVAPIFQAATHYWWGQWGQRKGMALFEVHLNDQAEEPSVRTQGWQEACGL